MAFATSEKNLIDANASMTDQVNAYVTRRRELSIDSPNDRPDIYALRKNFRENAQQCHPDMRDAIIAADRMCTVGAKVIRRVFEVLKAA